MTRKAELLVPTARVALEGKKFIKARRLARILRVTPSLAGQCLWKMPEWNLWNKQAHGNRTWVRRCLD